jgi:photosynthetic reaction center H subunit
MQTVGYITSHLDLAQLLLYVFWVVFAGLIYYLVAENHREGYPMESSSSGRAVVTGWPIPEPKTFKLENGQSVTVPDLTRKEPPLHGVSTGYGSGSPLEPQGDPMKAALGAGAYSMRQDVPEMTAHGTPVLQPLRLAPAYSVAHQDVDPRGLPVMGGDGKQGGTVKDIWIDSAEMMFRYLEVETQTSAGLRHVLLPIPFTLIRRNQVEVHAIYGRHFADVPQLRNADQVTKLEEEMITAYYGGGTLYADPQRSQPLI